MAGPKNVSFANFTCKFGYDIDLLDKATEIVIPAFLDKTQRRDYGETSDFFLDVKVLNFAEPNKKPVLAIAGRIVKTTKVEREQTFVNGELVVDKKSLDSAPSAIFVLVLNNHKLIYYPETKAAPSLSTFRAVAQKFISNRHRQYIEQQKLEADAIGKPTTKRRLIELTPHPIVELIPLSSLGSLEDFINQFSALKSISIRIIQPNDEIDNEALFSSLLQSKRGLGATTTELVHKNAKGLLKDEAVGHLGALAEKGNTEIKLVGEDDQGDILRGNNESFKLALPVEGMPKNVGKAAVRLFASLNQALKSGLVKIAVPAKSTTKVLEDIASKFVK